MLILPLYLFKVVYLFIKHFDLLVEFSNAPAARFLEWYLFVGVELLQRSNVLF